MKIVNLIFLIFIFENLFSQQISEQEIKSQINQVSVFIKGTQVTRIKTVNLYKGESIVKFVNLSPFIDKKSVQVKAKGALSILSVNHQQNYLNKLQKTKELRELEKRLEAINDKIKLEKTHLSILGEEFIFLNNNRTIGGKNEQLTLTNFQQIATFYTKKMTELKLKEIERRKTLDKLNKSKNDLQNQINTLNNKKDYPSGEVVVKVDAKETNSFLFELSYLVHNSGWFPTYDVRVEDINNPVQLVYKANVKQDTKVDWNNVKLTFSSAEPDASGVAPELQTYFLNYNTLPPVYRNKNNSVRGKVLDYQGNILAGARIEVEGTTIGTVSDNDGNYSITTPNGIVSLTYSHVGFAPKTLPVSSSVMNVYLELGTRMMENSDTEIATLSNNFEVRAMGEYMKNEDKMLVKTKQSIKIPTQQVVNQTNMSFEIKTPYTIKSDNKNYTVDMEYYDLSATYQYYCVPKISTNAFLMAYVNNWEKYNLLEGEANLFFENTYVGKSILDLRNTNDTLKISLGKDKNVVVKREKIKDFVEKQLIGNKKEEIRTWKTSVKNNKNQTIRIILFDQVPVSTNEEIEVKILELSGGKHNLTNGQISWEFELSPHNKAEFDLKYSVKYPKNKHLIIE